MLDALTTSLSSQRSVRRRAAATLLRNVVLAAPSPLCDWLAADAEALAAPDRSPDALRALLTTNNVLRHVTLPLCVVSVLQCDAISCCT
jgi:hypothetical protein